MAVNIFLTALSVLCSQGMRVKEGSTGIIYEYNITRSAFCSRENPRENSVGEDAAACQAHCNAKEWCKGFSMYERDGDTACYFTNTSGIVKKEDVPMTCYARIEAPTPPPTKATIHGDPHVVNIQGDHFDIKRPGLHDLIVVPARLGDKLRLGGLVTPLGGARCSNKLYFTEIHISGSFLDPLRNLEFSTSGRHFDRPDAVGLRVDGSANMSIPEFIKKVPAHMAQVEKLHPGMVKTLHGHADILLAHVSLGPVKLKIGWAHTWSPLSNWMWLEITDGLPQQEVGGLMGNADFTWASSRPEGCP